MQSANQLNLPSVEASAMAGLDYGDSGFGGGWGGSGDCSKQTNKSDLCSH